LGNKALGGIVFGELQKGGVEWVKKKGNRDCAQRSHFYGRETALVRTPKNTQKQKQTEEQLWWGEKRPLPACIKTTM